MLSSKVYILNIPPNLPSLWRIEALRLLDINERKRYQKYTNPRKTVFLLGRWLLKTTLSQYLNCPPEKIIIGLEKNGKPFVKKPKKAKAIHISLTHSGTLIACSICAHSHGLDIESIKRAPEKTYKIGKLINQTVLNTIKRLLKTTKHTKKTLFTTFWTYLETLVKIHGSTLFQEKNSFMQNAIINPRNLAIKAHSMCFYSYAIEQYILGYGYNDKEVNIKPRYIEVKRRGKKRLFVTKY